MPFVSQNCGSVCAEQILVFRRKKRHFSPLATLEGKKNRGYLCSLGSLGQVGEKLCDFGGIFRIIWVFPKIGTPKWMEFLMENPIKMDDLGVPPFSETPICVLNTCR